MSRRSAEPCRAGDDSGSAVVDFVLIGALTTFLFAGVLQLALALHVRATLVDCAAEGARYGALADRDPEQGAQRTRDLIGMALSPAFAQDVSAASTTVDGLPVVRVEVTAALPVLGLLGPAGALTVDGHALAEAP
ncbi:TadE/TadG family type IV pilus assembly protein [Actinotalea subterranea]|uniref:TadE/TadG family type IV pilus assembly protein n=1 Tax=Actinotalea subterranea TaxID=2607497 RepID=UPI0011ECC55B|nr:TadE family protein [Actinotalea subterranea]